MQKNQLFLQKKQEAFEDPLGNGKILQALQETHSSQGNQVIFYVLAVIFE